jgi:hypothetical protein
MGMFLSYYLSLFVSEKVLCYKADWYREDLRVCTSKEWKEWKDHIVRNMPELLTSPHGALLKKSRDWEIIYMLSGTVPRAELIKTPYETDLQICTVVWKHTSGLTGLTFYNNHLDFKARFSHFVEDGATTSRANIYAVGEKGKGFILATQYLIEKIEDNMQRNGNTDKLDVEDAEVDLQAKAWKPKVSFRVGNKIGEFAWRKDRGEDGGQLLRVSMDDLSPVDISEFIRRRGKSLILTTFEIAHV